MFLLWLLDERYFTENVYSLYVFICAMANSIQFYLLKFFARKSKNERLKKKSVFHERLVWQQRSYCIWDVKTFLSTQWEQFVVQIRLVSEIYQAPNKMLANRIQQRIKRRIYLDKVGFIQGMENWLNIQKTIYIIKKQMYHLNKSKWIPQWNSTSIQNFKKQKANQNNNKKLSANWKYKEISSLVRAIYQTQN